MFLDQAMNVMEKIAKEIKEVEPDKRDHLIKSAVTLLDISTEALRESPAFRKAFLQIHAEFLNYPESEAMIQKSIEAYNKYTKEP